MTEKDLFNAIDDVDMRFVEETLNDMEHRKLNAKHYRLKIKFSRLIAAALIFITIMGTSLTIFAAVNSDFRDWIYQSFSNERITEITEISEYASKLDLKQDLQIKGENESFIEKFYYDENDREIVSSVYRLKNGRLKKLKLKNFSSSFNNIDFSFDYCVINSEIDGVNCTENIGDVFPVLNGNKVYITLDDEKNVEEYLLEIDLKTEKINCLLRHKHFCNSIMSPEGKTILFNYRAESYWTVYDIQTDKEVVIDNLDGYLHTNEILFLDDYLVETYHYSDETDEPETIVIDLKTLKTKTVCKETGDLSVNWQVSSDKDYNRLKIKNLYTDSVFYINGIAVYKNDFSVSVSESQKNFALLYNEYTSEYYLCDLVNEKSMKINAENELTDEINMYIADNDSKVIIENGTDAYLIDVSNMK